MHMISYYVISLVYDFGLYIANGCTIVRINTPQYFVLAVLSLLVFGFLWHITIFQMCFSPPIIAAVSPDPHCVLQKTTFYVEITCFTCIYLPLNSDPMFIWSDLIFSFWPHTNPVTDQTLLQAELTELYCLSNGQPQCFALWKKSVRELF